MASSKGLFEFVREQLLPLDGVSFRAMMGEYIIYVNGVVVGGLYDDRVLIKDNAALREMLGEIILEKPYDTGREMILIEDVDDSDALCRAFYTSFTALAANNNRGRK